MGEQSVSFVVGPTAEQAQDLELQSLNPQEQFQLPPILDKIHDQTDGTPESIKEYFETLSFDEFTEILNKLNGYYRNIPGQHEMDGDGKISGGYIPPDPKDRVLLFEEAFNKAIKEDSPEKCATALGLSILVIHPYLDGNGRTSRTIFALLTNGYSGSDRDKTLFTEIGGRDYQEKDHKSNHDIINLDPDNVKAGDYFLSDLINGEMKWSALTNRFGNNLTDYPVNASCGGTVLTYEYNIKSQLTQEEQMELQDLFSSNAHAFVACVNSFSDKLYKKSLKHIKFEGKEYDTINYDNIIEDITRKEFINLKKEFRKARVDYVRAMMNVTKRDYFQEIYDQYSAKLERWKNRSDSIKKKKEGNTF